LQAGALLIVILRLNHPGVGKRLSDCQRRFSQWLGVREIGIMCLLIFREPIADLCGVYQCVLNSI